MLSSKQRAYLSGLANKIDPIFQIGKGGVSDTLINEISLALEAREIVKIKVLNNSLLDARECAVEIAHVTKSEVVSVIGSRFVLYRKSEKDPKINLPKGN